MSETRSSWSRRGPTLVWLALALWFASQSLTILQPGDFGVRTRLGVVTGVLRESGPALAWPAPIGAIERIDGRLQVLDVDQREYLTRDKRNIVVSAYVVWRVVDPLAFWKALRNDPSYAASRITDLTASSLGSALGRLDFDQLIAEGLPKPGLDAALTSVREQTSQAETALGVMFEDVRIKRVSFPEANRFAVYRRMESERARIAAQFRSAGEVEAARIRSSADLQRTQLLAEAQRRAEQIRGEAEAESARVVALAAAADPELYAFLRTLDVYRRLFSPETTLVLTDDEPFLRLFFDGPAGIAPAPHKP